MQHMLETLAFYYVTYVLPYGSALTTIARMVEATFGPVVKQKAPRLAHLIEAVAAISVDVWPFLKSLYFAVTKKPWPTLPSAVAVASQEGTSSK